MKIKEKILKRHILKLCLVGTAFLFFAGTFGSGRMQTVDKRKSTQKQGDISRAAFAEAYKVFMSPRCVNCHPAGDIPFQGDALIPHAQGVTRGEDGKGKYGMKCATCHQTENLPGEKMPPGVPNWHMPPADMKMVFEGRTVQQLCRQFKNPRMNGRKRTVEEAMEHLKADPLVLWAWKPGNGRTTPPLSHKVFIAKIDEWIKNGAACPD